MEKTSEHEMNPAESLAIISNMINQAKSRLADDGFLFIFWGWLVFIAATIQYISIILQSEYGNYVWTVLLPIGAVVSIIYSLKQKKKEIVRTYIDTYLAYLWTAFGISLLLTLIFMSANGFKATYFFLMLLYGVATFISGGLLNFKPLVYGSLFSFAFAVVSIFAGEKELLLCLSAALLLSYIIPGHLLRSKFKSQHV